MAGKLEKTEQWRREGMIYALKVAEEKGVEALRKELLYRGIFKLSITLPMEHAEEAHSFIGQNLYQSVISTVLWVLKKKKGYGTKRLQEFKQWYDEEAQALLDLNWHGEHYVTLEDRALELNRDHGFNFDLARLSVLKEEDDKHNPNYRKMDLEETCNFLRREGYADAAECLKKKVEWLRA